MKKRTVLATLALTGALLVPALSASAQVPIEMAPTPHVAAAAHTTKKLTHVSLKASKKSNRVYLTVKGNAKTVSKKTPVHIRNAANKKTLRTCTTVSKCSTYLSTSVKKVYATWGKYKTAVYKITVKISTAPTLASVTQQLKVDATAVTTVVQALPKNPSLELSAATKKDYSASDIKKAFPAGTLIKADPSTWVEQIGYNTGRIGITITRPGQKPVRYVAIMVQDTPGAWKVLATVGVDQ